MINETNALTNKNNAQLNVDTQKPIRDAAYLILQEKQNSLDIANINLITTQTQYPSSGQPGLNAYLYDCWTPWNLYNNAPEIGCGAIPIAMGPWTSMYWNFGNGGPANLYDDYQIRLVGYIKQTQHWTPQFRTCGDDGMIIKINGNTIVNNWWDRGGGCGASNGYYMSTNEWVPIEIWWYENGGGAWGEAQWNIGNGFTTIPSSVLSTEIPIISQEVIDAQNIKNQAQLEYNNALLTYNIENDKLINYQLVLNDKNNIYNQASDDLDLTESALIEANSQYSFAITEMQNAILNAQTEYNNQLDFENKQRVAAAIAQALANQPVTEPSPIPTIETSPEPEPIVTPSPETTSEPYIDQTPEPTPTPESSPSKDEASPSPEPSPEPTPTQDQIETTQPETSPEPTPSKNNIDNSTTIDTLRLLSNLTSKDTLTKLTDEQKEAVASSLGIKTEDISLIAELAKNNEAISKALESFANKIEENKNALMPYTLADAITEEQVSEILSNPAAAVQDILSVDVGELLSNFSELGMDMTDDQREKAQEIIVPVILASNIIAAASTIRRNK